MRWLNHFHALFTTVYQLKYSVTVQARTFYFTLQKGAPMEAETPCAAPVLYDMHCHLDFATDARALAASAERAGVGAFSTTVDPRDYERTRAALAPWNSIRVGLGLHPWWLADGRCGAEEVALFVEEAPDAGYIGEVGLDFSPRREGTFAYQEDVFARLMEACAPGNHLISIHAVRSAATVLDVLESTGVLADNAVILHWFSGTAEELHRAVRLGCSFSIGTRMLATKRGRAYARSLPADRLLLETDLPDDPDTDLTFERWQNDLAEALGLLAEARGAAETSARAELQEQVALNSRRALACAER